MKPKLIVSIPNAGSDWFARSVAEVTGWPYWDKEFFNPICNLPITDRLIESGFGCELAGAMKNIWSGPHKANSIYQRFLETGCTLNKEVWAGPKLDWFAERFDIVILLRSKESLFPPSRLRVLQWYEAAAISGGCLGPTFLDNVQMGYEALSGCLERTTHPTIWYDRLCMDGGLDPIRDWIGDDRTVERISAALRSSRIEKTSSGRFPVEVGRDDRLGIRSCPPSVPADES